MLVATKVKLSMERLMRLNGAYMAGKVAGGRQFEAMGRVVDRSIASQNSIGVSR